ncbi:MFS transporter, partial [Streptomyces sp. TRM76130]|nr:MFS transporter [Streptomyces sp. TRM76130]
MAALQGLGAVLAGTLAQLTSAATAITLMAAGSVTVTLTLALLGRREERRPAVLPGTGPTESAPAG